MNPGNEDAPFLSRLSEDARRALRIRKALKRETDDSETVAAIVMSPDEVAAKWRGVNSEQVTALMDEIVATRRLCVSAMGRLPSPLGRATPEKIEEWKRDWVPVFRTWKALQALCEAVESIRSVRSADIGEPYEEIRWLDSISVPELRSPEHGAWRLYMAVGKRLYRETPKYKRRRSTYDADRYAKVDGLREKKISAQRERRKDPAYVAREREAARRRYQQKKQAQLVLDQIDQDNDPTNTKEI